MAENESRPVGRPTIMTVDTLQKLEEAFLIGASDKEACIVAGISTTTLYNFQEENPEYVERKELLKNMPKYQARKVIVKALYDEDRDMAKWFGETKMRDEFSKRTETTGKDGKDLLQLQPSDRLIELADKLNNEHRPKLHTEGVSGSIGTDTDTVGTAE